MLFRAFVGQLIRWDRPGPAPARPESWCPTPGIEGFDLSAAPPRIEGFDQDAAPLRMEGLT
jgi:hypothetical protein